MTNEELIKKLRDLHRDPRPASAEWLFENQVALYDAAAAIEALMDAEKTYLAELAQCHENLRRAAETRRERDERIEALQAEVKRLQDKLCDWCAVCPKERRKPEDCEMLSETPVMYGPSDAKMEVQDGE